MDQEVLPADNLPQMVRVHQPQVWCYVQAPVYLRVVGGDFTLYKPAGTSLLEKVPNPRDLPAQLYMRWSDKARSIHEVQACLDRELSSLVAIGDARRIKRILVTVVEETFSQPKVGNLEGLRQPVANLVEGLAGRPELLRELILISQKDYTTALHSVNVALLTIAYCLHNSVAQEQAVALGLGALLHDLGKLFVDNDILAAQRRLTEAEFELVKQHPEKGGTILRTGGFDPAVARVALEHHERVDGSGYPRGVNGVSDEGQIVGIIDCYEALTSDERYYREPLDGLGALRLLKEEVLAGKFHRGLFERFAYSLI